MKPHLSLRRRLPDAILKRQRARGLTLVELMISLALGMLVVSAAIALFLSSKSSYTVEDDTARLLDNGRYAIESVTRALRQASFENLASYGAVPIVSNPNDSPNIFGTDDGTLVDGGTGVPAPSSMGEKHSDILETRFFGSPDAVMLNCAGTAIAAPTSAALADAQRGWSVFFVRPNPPGEAELRCGFLNTAGVFDSTPLASGIESFQVLYGVDLDGDGVPDRYLAASDVSALDPTGVQPSAPGSVWKRVVGVKIAMLMRGQLTQRADAQNSIYDLFGNGYINLADAGTRINEGSIPAVERSRTRKLFTATIVLRNDSAGGTVVALP